MRLKFVCSALLLLATSSFAAEPDLAQSPNLLERAAAAGELDRAASLLDADERETRDKYDSERQELKDLEERLLVQGRAYVRLSKPGFMALALGFERYIGRASRVERLRRSIARDLLRQRVLNRSLVELGERLLAQRKQRGPLSAAQLSRLRERSTRASAEERALAFERAFASTAEEHTAVYAASVPFGGPVRNGNTFASMKGRLPFPVAGRTEILLAKRRGGGGPGLELRALAGTPVQAIYAGRVVFSDKYADYGQTVILDHGDGYFTVSAGLSTPLVKVGQDVAAGTRLGEVTDTGRGAALYFEIRMTGDPVNPSEWFGI
jgi:murein DD-endopeptidase MepM/ murein hydrolase activator NlpD